MKDIFGNISISKNVEVNSRGDTIENVQYTGFKTIILPKQEYAHVMEEINTHLSDEERTKEIVSKPIGNYIYTFENYGYSDFRIIGKKEIEGLESDIIDEKFKGK